MSATGLTIAVPRGALFKGTVDLLAGLGMDTEELRENDRKRSERETADQGS